MSKKTGSKAKKVIVTILVVLAALIAIVLIGARIYFRAPVSSYYKASEKAFVIPGLMDNMTPQGLDYVSSVDTYLICGYQKDGSPSRIYRVDGASGKDEGYVIMGDENGNGIKPHAGGLASHGEYLFVAGDEDACINIYKLNDVLSAKSGEVVKKVGGFSTKFGGDKINVAWICFADDRMIVGEFYRVPNYLTPDSHIFKGSAGEDNHAIALSYKLSNAEGSNCGVETQPFEAYSLPGLVQGMTVRNGEMWISQSYGTAKSTICSYNVAGSNSVGTIKTDNGEIPVYAFDKNTMTATFDAAPMAEEIVFVNGKLLIMSESASMKYIFGNFTGGRWCYATDVGKLL